MRMNCIACGLPNKMLNRQFLMASFVSAGPMAKGPHYICRECCSLAVMAWAIKAKVDSQDPPDAPIALELRVA